MESAVVFDLVSALLAVLGAGASGRLFVLLGRTRRDLQAQVETLDEFQLEHVEFLSERDLRIVDLEGALSVLRDEGERERGESELQLANLEYANSVLRDEIERERNESDRRVATLEGALGALRDRGERYDAIVQGHQWHLAGRVVAHGKELSLYECGAGRADPLANVRVLVKAGVMPE